MFPTPRGIDWTNAAFLILSPIVAVAGTAWWVSVAGFHWMDLTLFWVYYWLTGIAITAGYHRLYSHKSYSCHPVLEFLYLCVGAATLENSALRWARDHRLHHQYVDTDIDPYSIKRGGFFAHMGWIFYRNDRDLDFSKVPDLVKNKLVMWQHRNFMPLAIFVGFLVPTAIGALVGRGLGAFLWAGLFRVVLVQHQTFCINSLAHMFGSQRYSESDSARDSWWLAYITYGEGYHNFHHRFPADYRNGHRWWHFDPGKWWIEVMHQLGLVGRMSRHPDSYILRVRLELEMRRARRRIAHLPEHAIERFERRLAAAKQKVETAAARWQIARARYRTATRNMVASSSELREMWKLKLRAYRKELEAAQTQWRAMLAAAGGLPSFAQAGAA